MTEKASRIRRSSSQPKQGNSSSKASTKKANSQDKKGSVIEENIVQVERIDSTTPDVSVGTGSPQGHVDVLPAAAAAAVTTLSRSGEEIYEEESVYFDDYVLGDDEYRCLDPTTYNQFSRLPPVLDTARYTEYTFVSQFVSLISSSRRSYSPSRQRSWLFDLPELVVTTSVPSIRYSIRAAALIYHAVVRQNQRAGMDAVRCYLAGMRSYRASVLGPGSRKSTSSGPKSSRLPDSRVICVPLMFSLFEAMQGITSNAEIQHHTAAAEMLESRGPEGCASGMEHGMMRSVRSMEAFHSIMQNRQARFSSPEWLSVPFQQKEKICQDLFIDILLTFTRELRLPRIHHLEATIRDAIYSVHDLPTYRKDDMEQKARSLMSRLHDWWQKFEKEHQEIIFPGSLYFPHPIDTAITSPASVLPMSASWMFSKKETLASSMVSLYSAANIILHSVLLIIALSKRVELEAESGVPEHQAAIASHSTSVFHAAMYLKVINPFCGDAIRAIFSTRIVSLLALENAQREQAQSMLQEWGLSSKSVQDDDSFRAKK